MITKAEIFEDKLDKQRRTRLNATFNAMLFKSLQTQTKGQVLAALFGEENGKTFETTRTKKQEFVF